LSALGLADYVLVLVPGLGLLPVAFFALALGAGVAVLNIRVGALVTGVFLAVETAALVTVCLAALTHPSRSVFTVLAHPVMLSKGALAPTPVFALALAGVAGLWATGGAAWALYFGEEMLEARRKIGRVIAWTGALASVSIAGPMVLMLTSAPDLKGALSAEAPMAAFLASTAGPAVAAAVSVGVVAAIFNSLVACLIAYSRYIYSTGRDGVWSPRVNRWLATLHPRFHSPILATLVLAFFAGLCLFLGEKFLLILISSNVFDYLLMALAVFVGRRTGRTGRDFKIPLHPLTPIFGLSVTVLSLIADWFDPDAGRPSAILLSGLFLGALAYYHFRLRQASQDWRMDVEQA
jgi:amino acid transporter